jgi:hypothetical protein
MDHPPSPLAGPPPPAARAERRRLGHARRRAHGADGGLRGILARERAAEFVAGLGEAAGAGGAACAAGAGGAAGPAGVGDAPRAHGTSVDASWEAALAGVRAATDVATTVDLDELAEPDVRAWLAGLQRQLDRLEGVKRRSTGTLRARAMRREGPGRESRARRDVDDFLTEALRLSPSDAKRTSNAGRDLTQNPTLAGAIDEGRLRPDHANVIADATRDLDPDLAGQVERTLTEAAAEQHPTELGRTARRLLAAVAPENAERAQRRSVQRRYARFTPQADGSLLINARVAAGIDAEVAQTWLDRYRTPDAEGEHRTPEQRTCDAMLAGMRAGLDDPCGPTVQGVAPHVTVLVTLADLVAGVGTGESPWSGPVVMSEVLRLLRNASLSTVVLDDECLPLEVRKARQQASVGLWRALVARDGGCRWPGCTAPPAWCDVAHAAVPARDGGVLKPDNAVLLCRRHHRQVDQPGWSIRIRGPAITFHRPGGRTIRAGPPQRAALATLRAGRDVALS